MHSEPASPPGSEGPPHWPGGEGFPKHVRLRRRREFLSVQRRGDKVHLRDLLVMVHPSKPRSPSRMGVTVTKKVGKAVCRNRIKRLVREVWRRNQGTMPPGLDLVFVAKRSAAKVTYAQLSRQLHVLRQRLGDGS